MPYSTRTPLAEYSKEKLIKTLLEYFENVFFSEHNFIPVEKNGKYKYVINAIK